MKQVLVIGAGQSSPYLIRALLEDAEGEGWLVTVGDVDLALAEQRIDGHPRGRAIHLDVNDESERSTEIERADVVVNMLGPQFQHIVAWDCVAHDTHMLSVSYRDQTVRDLDSDARRKGVLLLCELGLDPGIDHISAIAMIRRVRDEGGRIVGFRSYGSGVPAPGQACNPLNYVITWNPRNVVMAAEHGAQYMEKGAIKLVPWHHVFHHTWEVDVPGVGVMEAYPNRDSMSYMESFGLEHVQTMIRGTLRWPGWSETWAQIVRLGLPNETLRIPDLAQRTYREVTEMFLPLSFGGPPTESRLARYLRISPTGQIMRNLKWLGLLSDEPTGCAGDTPAAMLIDLLRRRLPLRDQCRDMVIIHHELDVEYAGRASERLLSTLVSEGETGGFTAMARTVGLPTAIAVRLLLRGEIDVRGARIPTVSGIFEPMLRDLADAGLEFTESAASPVPV